jgi:hypothetical protein
MVGYIKIKVLIVKSIIIVFFLQGNQSFKG